jgi:hypothetical protein
MDKQRVGHNIQDHATDGVESRERQPQKAEQPNVLLHPAGARLHERHWTDDLLATLAAKSLTRLHCCAASIAEHEFLPVNHAARISPQDTYNRWYAENAEQFPLK